MKKICFCFQIQIPAIPRNFRFFEIEQNHQYFSDSQIREHVKRVDANILVHFWEMLKVLSMETNGSFKAAVSIPGTTLTLLQKIVPDTITKLNELSKNNCIEFLSEPWSHSILPFMDKKLLSQQIIRHDELMHSLFGVTPKIFIAHSPFGSFKNLGSTITKYKSGILAYANFASPSQSKTKDLTTPLPNNKNLLLINHKVGQVFQKIDFDPNQNLLEQYVSKILYRINKKHSPLCPSIFVYNPVQNYNPFHLDQIIVWKKIIRRLQNFHGYQYTLPFDMFNFFNWNKPNNNPFGNKLKHYYLPNLWLTNKMQREVLNIQQEIGTIMKGENSTSLRSIWDYLQDMDNLFFMSNHYFKPQFKGQHSTPYSSPYTAYINYMNVLDSMLWKLRKQKSKPRQKGVTIPSVAEV